MSGLVEPPKPDNAEAVAENPVAAGGLVTDQKDNFDLTKKPGETEDFPGLSRLRTEPYDPSKDREKKRGYIALWLVGILTAIVVASFIFIFVHYNTDLSPLKSVLDILFAPIVGLVGAATGFYFGEKSK